MVICYVSSCKSRSERKCKNITFHTFPKDSAVRQLWTLATGRSNWAPNEFTRICSRHFEPSCFLRKNHNNRTFLKRYSVPTLHIADQNLKKSPHKQLRDPLSKGKSDYSDEEAEKTGETTDDALATDGESETLVPETEKVFVKSIEVTKTRGHALPKRAQPNLSQGPSDETQSKRTRLDIFTAPPDYAEKIYEFGKFVAEQLLCLSEDEASLAQIEIRDILLKYYENKDSLSNYISSNEELVKEEIFEAEEEQIGSNVLTFDNLSVTQSVPKANVTGALFTQATLKGNIDKPSQTKPVLPQLNIIRPLVKIGRLKVNQSNLQNKTDALSRNPGIQPTKRVITARSLVTQPSHVLSAVSSVASTTALIGTQPSSGFVTAAPIAGRSTSTVSTKSQLIQPRETSVSSVTQPFSIVISAGSIVTQPFSRVVTSGSTVSQSPTRLISTGSLATQSSTRVISAKPPVTQPYSIVISAGSIITKPSPIVISAGSIMTQSPPRVISVGSLMTRPSPRVMSAGSIMTQPFSIVTSVGSPVTQTPSRKTLSGTLVELTPDSECSHVNVYKIVKNTV